MRQLYGESFCTIHGETPSPIWLAAVSKLTDEQCMAGLKVLLGEAREYPANLTEFVAACKPKQSVRYLGGPSSRYDRKALSAPLATAETRAKYLASMRTLFGRREPEVEEPGLGRNALLAEGCTCGGMKPSGECPVCLAWLARGA